MLQTLKRPFYRLMMRPILAHMSVFILVYSVVEPVHNTINVVSMNSLASMERDDTITVAITVI
jgi:hypothetical protein